MKEKKERLRFLKEEFSKRDRSTKGTDSNSFVVRGRKEGR
jgi:hypothetical protein